MVSANMHSESWYIWVYSTQLDTPDKNNPIKRHPVHTIAISFENTFFIFAFSPMALAEIIKNDD